MANNIVDERKIERWLKRRRGSRRQRKIHGNCPFLKWQEKERLMTEKDELVLVAQV